MSLSRQSSDDLATSVAENMLSAFSREDPTTSREHPARLKMSLQKSSIYAAGMSCVDLNSIKSSSLLSEGKFPFRYLGLPVAGIECFWLSSLPMPAGVRNKINTLRRNSFGEWERVHPRQQEPEWIKWVINRKFNSKTSYDFFRPRKLPLTWPDLVWHSSIILRHSFIMWLGLKERLQTKDKLQEFIDDKLKLVAILLLLCDTVAYWYAAAGGIHWFYVVLVEGCLPYLGLGCLSSILGYYWEGKELVLLVVADSAATDSVANAEVALAGDALVALWLAWFIQRAGAMFLGGGRCFAALLMRKILL
ncbi:hypothetical protein Acr_08g0014740 [Actinidia rufa]|uniref:Reverse transcriptase zinc-binding domain-containing protein n=1 Tax=Actinidia rufa TaxID=165716 RepID=A0A7J0F306_9ERIC|nr:hypothetical protein Acr_08g0014740 [Actinidia rufa]